MVFYTYVLIDPRTNSPFYIGKQLTSQTREKLRIHNTGSGNPMFGRKHSEQTKLKMQLAREKRRV